MMTVVLCDHETDGCFTAKIPVTIDRQFIVLKWDAVKHDICLPIDEVMKLLGDDLK